MDNNSKIRKIIKTTLNEWLNEQEQYINIDDIKTEKEMIPVDTKNVNDVISTSRSGKMPLDKLRVMTMVDKLNGGGTLPPVKINDDNMLIDGHHRYMAYKLANINKIPFVRWVNF
jgi:ParB-like chromosome segregation protein Spo0J